MRSGSLVKLLVIGALALVGVAVALHLYDLGCVGAVCPRDDVRITRFEAEAALQADGTVTVSERFTMRFDTPQREVRRDIPAAFRDPDGVWYRVPLVVRNAKVADNVVTRNRAEVSGTSVRVWIGDGKTEYFGEHEFGLTYVLNGGLRESNGQAVFVWDVIGPDQRMPVEHVTAKITANLSEAAMNSVRASCSGGDPECVIDLTVGEATFTAPHPIVAAIALPPESLPILPTQKIGRFAPLVPLLPLILPLLLFIWLSWRWLRQPEQQMLSRWRLLLILPMIAAPLAFNEAVRRMPQLSAVGSGPNAVAALAACVFEACLFGLLALATSGRAARTSSPSITPTV